MFMPASSSTSSRYEKLSKLRTCQCEKPHRSSNPRSEGTCAQCGYPFGAEWDQTTANFNAFWERIESSYAGWQFPLYEPPDEQQTLRLQTQHRELAGRKQFGYSYLSRDNLREAREEIADCLMYLYLDTLRCEREGADPEWDVVLSIADDLLSAYGKFDQLRHKHRGAP